MAEEGLTYYFIHTAAGHLLTICDDSRTLKNIPEPTSLRLTGGRGMVTGDEAFITRFDDRTTLVPGATAAKDFNCLTPRLPLSSGVTAGPFKNLEIYDYPGGYDNNKLGHRYAKIRLEQLQSLHRVGDGDVSDHSRPSLTSNEKAELGLSKFYARATLLDASSEYDLFLFIA